MTALRVFVSRFWGALTLRRRDAALSEEIETHLSLLADDFEAGGMSRAEAMHAARREFGAVAFVKETTREERGFPGLESIAQDGRFALRQLRRSPSFTVAAVLTLGVGIGGTTAIYSVLDLVAFRPLPYPNAERLVTLQESLPTFGPFPVSIADAEYWRSHSRAFDTIALAGNSAATLTGNGEPERLSIALITPDFLHLLGATPHLGRLLVDEDNVPGRDRVVVIDAGLWRRRFNSDPTVVGQTLVLDGVGHEIVGVLPPSFRPPNTKWLHSLPTREIEARVWKPLAPTPEQKVPIGGYSYASLGRLKDGVTIEAAREELAEVQRALVRSVAAKGELRTVLAPIQAQMASRSRDSLILILLAVATVLVIGCANIGGLLISRMLSRQREIAVREALGADRLRIARQLAVEHLVLAGLGGLVGVVVALATFRLIVLMAPADVPRLEILTLDTRVLTIASIVSLAAAALLSVAPALRTRAFELQSALTLRGDSHARPGAQRLRSTLVVGEIAAGTTVLAVAMLLTENFSALLVTERGFRTESILTTEISMAGQRYQDPVSRRTLFDSLARDLRGLPGVEFVAATSQLPLTGTGALSAVSVEGTTADVASRPSSDVRSVTPDFFAALDIPLTRGRLLESADSDRNVVVVSDALAQRAWPGRDPLGQRFRFGANPANPVYTVVGTVGDIRAGSLDQPVSQLAYVPFPQRSGGVTLLLRTTGDPASQSTAVREMIQRHDPAMPIQAFRTMTDVANASLGPQRFQLRLVTLFAITAALLAGLGIYGTLAYSVAQRRAEIGVRLALGERTRAVIARIVTQSLRLTGAGVAIALLLIASSGSILHTLTAGAVAFNPLALAAATGAIVVMSMIAAAVPAIRAGRVDPASALRGD